LTRLEIEGFRNLSGVAFDPHPTLNLLNGPNGAGKSSVLEAIQCLSTGHSFRSRKARELVSSGKDQLSIVARLRDLGTNRGHRIGLARGRDGTLTMRLDYEAVDNIAQATRLLPVKTLSPDSHALVQEGPEERRRFLDWGVFHVEPRFFDVWRLYRRALSQRNQALRDQRSDSEVWSWDEQLIEAGEQVDAYRRAYVGQLAEILQARSENLGTPLGVALRYRGGWAEGTALGESLANNRLQHRRMRTTTDGPHRAELAMTIDAVPVRQLLSRGQQKVLVYLMHLSQLELMAARSGRQAIVLCDDLLSELDGDNVDDVVVQLLELAEQVFVSGVTTVPLERYDHRRFHVKQGCLTAVQ